MSIFIVASFMAILAMCALASFLKDDEACQFQPDRLGNPHRPTIPHSRFLVVDAVTPPHQAANTDETSAHPQCNGPVALDGSLKSIHIPSGSTSREPGQRVTDRLGIISRRDQAGRGRAGSVPEV